MLENWLFGHLLWSNQLSTTRSCITKEKNQGWAEAVQPKVVELAAQTMAVLQITNKSQLWQAYTAPVSLCYWSPLLYSTLEKQLVASRQLIPSHNRTWKRSPVRQLKTHFVEHMLDYSTVRWAHICLCPMSVSGRFYNCSDVTSAWITEKQWALAATAADQLCQTVAFCSLGRHWLKFRLYHHTLPAYTDVF